MKVHEGVESVADRENNDPRKAARPGEHRGNPSYVKDACQNHQASLIEVSLITNVRRQRKRTRINT